MAKRRKEELTTVSNINFGDAFQSELSKMCDFEAPEPVLCSTGSSLLDTIVGGGLSTGKYHVFAAPAHSGKSTTCIRTIANFLNTYKNGLALWVDGEQATPPGRLMQLGIPYQHQKDETGNDIIDPDTGLPIPIVNPNNRDDVKWDQRFFRVPYNVTLEKAFGLIDKCIEIKINFNQEDTPLLVVFDSIDSLPSEKELETDNPDQAIGQKSKVLGYYMKRFLFKLRQYNICVIFIAHIGKKLSMMGPYEAYDGRMSSLKDFTITGGKAMQFYPSNMIFFRSRMGATIDKELADMGIVAGSVVEATTMKAKNFSSNLSVSLVFNTLKGFDEYPTRFLNMKKNDWLKGTGVSRYLPEFPEDKFNAKSFFEKLKDPSFKEKVDVSWANYLTETYRKYHSIMATMNDINQNIDFENFDPSHVQSYMREFFEEGDVGETEAQTPNTASFDEEPQELQIPTV